MEPINCKTHAIFAEMKAEQAKFEVGHRVKHRSRRLRSTVRSNRSIQNLYFIQFRISRFSSKTRELNTQSVSFVFGMLVVHELLHGTSLKAVCRDAWVITFSAALNFASQASSQISTNSMETFNRKSHAVIAAMERAKWNCKTGHCMDHLSRRQTSNVQTKILLQNLYSIEFWNSPLHSIKPVQKPAIF